MSSYVEVSGRNGRELRALDTERTTVGTLESNDVVVDVAEALEDGVHAGDAVGPRDVSSLKPSNGLEPLTPSLPSSDEPGRAGKGGSPQERNRRKRPESDEQA